MDKGAPPAVNIVCMKWGELYGPEYVNNLYRMVQRNLSLPFRFICLTEQATGLLPDINVLPLPNFAEPPPPYGTICSAWRKLALFGDALPGVKGKVLFLDLDVVIVDRIDALFAYSDRFAIIENWYQRGRNVGQASGFCFTAGAHAALYQAYLDDPKRAWIEYRTEQAFMTAYLSRHGGFDFFPDAWFKSFKKHCMPGGVLNRFCVSKGFPKACKVVVFHGQPNPPGAIAGTWGRPVSWYKKLHRHVRPTAWVAEFWR